MLADGGPAAVLAFILAAAVLADGGPSADLASRLLAAVLAVPSGALHWIFSTRRWSFANH